MRKHRSYVAARAVEVMDPSPQRVEAPCPYFGQCTLMRLIHRMGIYPSIDPSWVPPDDCSDCNRLAREAKCLR